MVEPYHTSKQGLRPTPNLTEGLIKADDIDDNARFTIEEVVGSSWDK